MSFFLLIHWSYIIYIIYLLSTLENLVKAYYQIMQRLGQSKLAWMCEFPPPRRRKFGKREAQDSPAFSAPASMPCNPWSGQNGNVASISGCGKYICVLDNIMLKTEIHPHKCRRCLSTTSASHMESKLVYASGKSLMQIKKHNRTTEWTRNCYSAMLHSRNGCNVIPLLVMWAQLNSFWNCVWYNMLFFP